MAQKDTYMYTCSMEVVAQSRKTEKDEGLGNGEVHHTVVSLWDVVSQEVEGFEFSVDR